MFAIKNTLNEMFHDLGAMLTSSSARQRFPFAVRAGLCCFIPIMIGVAVGDVASGLLATIGSFTALYGSDRPYVNRAFHLAIVALLMASVVVIGIIISPYSWIAIVVVALIAAGATFICNAMRVGPPGAYMFALACASGTGMGGHVIDPWNSGFWVMCGGIISWLAHMLGFFIDRYQPERMAVINAANAIAALTDVSNKSDDDKTRLQAAENIDKCWVVLVNWQTSKTKMDPVIQSLRLHLQHLHAIFASEVSSSLSSKDAATSFRKEALAVARDVAAGNKSSFSPQQSILLTSDSFSGLLKPALRRWSVPLQLALRVGIATLISGWVGVGLKLDHAYWGMAAVVVVLNMPYGWAGTTQRALFRIVGTLAGILLAWAILSLHPQGLWIAVTVALLQFVIEIWVVLQYAVAATFITANAMVIASGGRSLSEIGHLLSARAFDTLIGCGIAIAVFILTARRTSSRQIDMQIRLTLTAILNVLDLVARDSQEDSQLFRARKALYQQAIILQQVVNAQASVTATRTKQCAAVDATERAAWLTLSACWQGHLSQEQALNAAEKLKPLLNENCAAGLTVNVSNSESDFLSEELEELSAVLIRADAQ